MGAHVLILHKILFLSIKLTNLKFTANTITVGYTNTVRHLNWYLRFKLSYRNENRNRVIH